MAKKMTMIEAAETIHGTCNDARFWDGWRNYGDAWARRYLRASIRRGADRMGTEDQIRSANAVLGV